jgi:DNA-binding NarL/FixJ family response regulator
MPRKTLESLAILPRLHDDNIPKPSSSKEAREWLNHAASHLRNFINAGPHLQFVGYALLQYLGETDKKKEDPEALCAALGLIQPSPKRRKGQPKISLETTVEIITMLSKGDSAKKIAESLNMPVSRVERQRAKMKKLLGIRQHGAKPDRFSLEDMQTYRASLSQKDLVAMLSATITLKELDSD